MHLILTGATGLVGSAVLDAMIKTKDISRISILSRRPVAMADAAKDPRIHVIIHQDFEKYDSELLKQLKGANGCVWALGISQTQVGKEEYIKITKDYALEAAKAFATLPEGDNEPFRFIYVSGEGTTHTPGRFTPIFGRVKGETEIALAEMRTATPRLHTESVRPGFVDPSAHDAIKTYMPPPSAIMRVGRATLGPVMRSLAKDQMSPTLPLGKFLTEMAMGIYDGKMAGVGVFTVGQTNIVENVGFRRLIGLRT